MKSEKIQALVLTTVPHSDTREVVSLLTRDHGRISAISAVGSGKSARMRAARLLPLSLIETDMTLRTSGGMPTLRQFGLITVWRRLYMHPVRSSLALFTAEFLGRLCREAAPDSYLWDFAVQATRLLDTAPVERLGNFHIALLISLLPFAGIQPDSGSWLPGRYFDMREGVFRDFPPPHPDRLDASEAEVMMRLLRINFYNSHLFRFTRAQRARVLELLLRYYAIHFPGTSSLKSPEVLADVFG